MASDSTIVTTNFPSLSFFSSSLDPEKSHQCHRRSTAAASVFGPQATPAKPHRNDCSRSLSPDCCAFCAGPPPKPPVKAHLGLKLRQQTQGFPEKSHLKNPFFPGTSHDALQTPGDGGKLDCFCSPRKASPSFITAPSRDLRHIYLSGHASPENLHRGQPGKCARSPNPLTLFPDAAHASPRTPSRVNPANAHLASCKASPDPALSLVQQGFGMALTFLTRVSRVFTSMTLKDKAVCSKKNDSLKAVPSRETTAEAGVDALLLLKSITCNVYLALFHET